MHMYKALILFSLIILIYWIIIELFTVLFRFTGLPEDAYSHGLYDEAKDFNGRVKAFFLD